METRRLKNIAILILVLLNLFLLALLGYQNLQGERISRAMMEELGELFASEKLTLSVPAGAMKESLAPLTLQRQQEKESAIAAYLLGSVVAGESQGGGIFGYDGDVGTVRFRGGGGFDTVYFKRALEDPAVFARQFCDKFDYEDLVLDLENGTGTATAVQYVAGVPILGCSVTLTFDKGALVSAVGAYVDLAEAAAEGEEYMDAVTALVRFLDHRRSAGVVCSEVRGVRCVYQLRSMTTPPRLLPVWEVETDTYTYQVDGESGAVTRK